MASPRRALLNLRVDARALPLPSAAQNLRQKHKELTLPANCIGMMTAASMDSLGYCLAQKRGLSVEVYCTEALPICAGQVIRADECPEIGTINIWLLIHPGADRCRAGRSTDVDRSQTTAIRDLGLRSPLSLPPAAAQGTDSHAVLCPNAPKPLAYCGTRFWVNLSAVAAL